MSLNTTKDDTLKFRMDSETANLMERARGYVKLDKSKFVRHSIREKAQAIIAQHEKTTFTEEDWHMFFDMIDNPPKPTSRMKKAATKYKKLSNLMQFDRLDTKKHDRKDFDCGVEDLNLYLQRVANQDQKRSLTKVYVLVEGAQIIGYYTLSAHSVLRDNLPDNVKLASYKDIPFLLLGRLAVDKHFQGQGYGDALIFHAFKMSLEAAEKIGILGMIVDAKDEKAASFYEGFGFKRLRGTENRLALPLVAMEYIIREQTK